ncbi:hypothetical protein [Pseudorhodoferax sp. Leaf267]|uniref:hypothetical protein n=1 Tax=Pseudorhodoferax sp. Leaf267 TaxID=1736316 RepID=UPI000AF6869B|nr:hypothetical protein [Pseudorhodoferax sp. Leaf267]
MKHITVSRRAWLAALAVSLASPFAAPVAAQTFPNKPLRLIVPFPAGGGTDAMARALGDALSRDLG